MILRAPLVLPISSPAIRNGAVRIIGKRISAIGRWRDLRGQNREEVVDLGDAILLPGLVNAHCHLDYTQMAGQFPQPKVFTDWLRLITSTKAGWDLTDYSESWSVGARMLVQSGTTTVADIEAVPQLLPKAWDATPLRVISLMEMIGITARRAPRAILAETLKKISSLRHPRCRAGLSPHAPYSTVPELLRLSARTARRRRWPVCIHVAESALEFAMFTQGGGDMFDWLKRSGRDMSDCGLGSPVQHLQRNDALHENLLVAHANYLHRRDAGLLAKNRVSVVHCPRSHYYFRHEPFALKRLVQAGVNVCLGTDSLASVCATRRQPAELSMLDEMRALAHREPALSSRTILRMATRNGARAIGLQGHVGEISESAFADLIAVPLDGECRNPYDRVLHHKGRVAASLIDGEWAIAPASLAAASGAPRAAQ
jgi:cytosine/adenosine deaminase-related metal-dependent hydrolase